MSTKPPLTTSEPARIVGGTGAVVAAVLGLLVAFGVPITEDQKNAILTVALVLTPIITAELVRRRVWSPASLARVLPEHDGAGPAPGDVDEKPGQHKREES